MEKIIFKDLPDETTPINAENLNKFQDNVEIVVNEKTTEMESKVNKTIQNLDEAISNATGVFVGTCTDEELQNVN